MLVSKTGSLLWRYGYRFEGKQKVLAFGSYPEVTLAEAREARRNAQQLLYKGIDPAAQKKKEKSVRSGAVTSGDDASGALTFRAVGREWYETKTQEREPRYRKLIRSRLENSLYPYIGDIPIDKLTPQDILAPSRIMVGRGHVDAAHRILTIAGQVCKYARVCGYCTFNPADGLVEALPTAKHIPRAAITTPEEVGHLLVAIDDCQSDVSIRYILKLLPYLFLRSLEIRCGRWEEVDFERAEWNIPANRMKRRRPHFLPLSRQALGLLKELHEFTGNGELMFPRPGASSKFITDEGLLVALRRTGYGKDQMCVHGFRSMAGSLLQRMGEAHNIKELQLSHVTGTAASRAYDRYEFEQERRDMMQRYADYLDSLRVKALKSLA